MSPATWFLLSLAVSLLGAIAPVFLEGAACFHIDGGSSGAFVWAPGPGFEHGDRAP